MRDAVAFIAAVSKVQTLADGGIRVTLDLPETAVIEAAQMMEYKRLGVALEITALPMKNMVEHGEPGAQVATGRERKSQRTPA